MTRMALFASLFASLIIVPTTATGIAQTTSPYTGQERRTIKALSDEEIRDLLKGRGMGFAKAAELNSYPGPLHVLQLANELGLSDEQRDEGPQKGAPALVAAGMMGDRADVIFAGPEEISGFIANAC